MVAGTQRPRRRVLIVDNSAASREVLRTALERRGLQIFEANRAQAGLEVARQCHPDLIVLDSECVAAETEAVTRTICDQYDTQSRGDHASLVVLGEVRCEGTSLPANQVVTKPYHYAPLIRKIEELLEHSLLGDRPQG